MKKKIFFIVTSLGAGGSEKVFWTLAQGFNKVVYEVVFIILDSRNNCFSMEIPGVRFIDMQSYKASRSIVKLYKLIRSERPFAIFSTTNHINLLVSIVAHFVRVPFLVARASNIPHQMKMYAGNIDRMYGLLTSRSYKKFDVIVCQSDEMKMSLLKEFRIEPEKLVTIPNPVNFTDSIAIPGLVPDKKRLIIVARLAKEKGLFRLLKVIQLLPANYELTIVGDGSLNEELLREVSSLNLMSRVSFIKQSDTITDLISRYDLFVLSSFTEGFPNAVLDALSVGLPVVSFEVGGINRIIIDDFNGYIIAQGDLQEFANKVLLACSRCWDHEKIKKDVFEKCALDKVAAQYESLLCSGTRNLAEQTCVEFMDQL